MNSTQPIQIPNPIKYTIEDAKIIQQLNEEYTEYIHCKKAEKYMFKSKQEARLIESLQKEEKRKQAIRDKMLTTPKPRLSRPEQRWKNWKKYIETPEQMKIFQDERKRILKMLG